MTFQTAAWAVDGNTMNGNLMRLAIMAATSNDGGVVGALDCICTATGTNAIVSIGSGGVLIPGTETTGQGSYAGWNPGTDSTLTISATGGSIRSDMVVVRAEDPTWSGSSWGNPASGQIIFPRVLSGVAAGATQVPAGNGSCIPLCRVDMPASTTNVQQSYIHDLRNVATPDQLGGVLSAAGTGTASNSGTTTTAIAWPGNASWTVAIPSWATQMNIFWTISDVTYHAVSNTLTGTVYPVFGSSVTAPVLAFPSYALGMTSTNGPNRHTLSGAASVAIGASLRNTSQTLQFAQVGNGTATDFLAYETGSGVSVFYQFQEVAATS